MKNTSTVFILCLAGWFFLNAFQGFFTELIHDEAYYWVYAQYLDWGYFDQPPMTALFIWAGWFFFEHEFGVRLLFVVVNAASLWLMWKTTDRDNPVLFFGIVVASLVAHLGFLAVPDIPLLFFVALFFYLSWLYLEKDSWKIALMLGIVVAAMGYSKYQGVIILLFALLSNLHLLKRLSFWVIPVLGSLLFLPHLLWQSASDYPTFRYHLYDRLSEPYSFMFPLEYILGQLLLFGPFIGFVYVWALYKFKPKTDFDRLAKWAAFGVLGFFLLMSFRGRTEANWTVAAFVPLVYITYAVFRDSEQAIRRIKIIAIASMVLFMAGRFYFVVDFLPEGMNNRNEIHGWDNWAEKVSEVAGEYPVIFSNNYQKAAKYQFYSGKIAHSANTVSYAGNQYDLMTKKEAELSGTDVLYISDWIGAKDTIFAPPLMPSPYRIMPAFTYFNRIKIIVDEMPQELPPDTEFVVDARIRNTLNEVVKFNQTEDEIKIRYYWFENRKYVTDGVALSELPSTVLFWDQEWNLKLKAKTPSEPGEYRFRFAIQTGNFQGRNSTFARIKVTEKASLKE